MKRQVSRLHRRGRRSHVIIAALPRPSIVETRLQLYIPRMSDGRWELGECARSRTYRLHDGDGEGSKKGPGISRPASLRSSHSGTSHSSSCTDGSNRHTPIPAHIRVHRYTHTHIDKRIIYPRAHAWTIWRRKRVRSTGLISYRLVSFRCPPRHFIAPREKEDSDRVSSWCRRCAPLDLEEDPPGPGRVVTPPR